jgi:hypothetical protein
MQNIKIKQTQDLDMTSLILERQAIKEIITQHGAIWFILFELFVLEDSMTINEFKTMFTGCVIGLPVFILSAYAGLILLSRFGGV